LSLPPSSPLLPILPITGVRSCRSHKIVRLNHPRASRIIPDVSELIPYLQNCANRRRSPRHCAFPTPRDIAPLPIVSPPRGEERRPRGDAERLPSRATPSPLGCVPYWPVCADASLISMDMRPFGPSRCCPAVLALDQGRERRRNGVRAHMRSCTVFFVPRSITEKQRKGNPFSRLPGSDFLERRLSKGETWYNLSVIHARERISHV